MKLFHRDPVRFAPAWAQPEWVERHVVPVACAFAAGFVLALLAAEAGRRSEPAPAGAAAIAAARYTCTAEAAR